MNTDDEESFTASVVFIKLPLPEIDGVGGGDEQKGWGESETWSSQSPWEHH